MIEAFLYSKNEDHRVTCDLCAHRCPIMPSHFGRCGVRQNIDGILMTHAYGQTVAEHIDPIEKKPLYHFLPHSQTYSISTIGCNFKCGFCQNGSISQQTFNGGDLSHLRESPPSDIVTRALDSGCSSISYTYTEPTIFFEYAYDIARIAKQKGLANIFVTNGYMTKEALDMIAPFLDACNVDLKAFSGSFYKTICKATLQPVLDTILALHQKKIWIELTTLLIPDQNDSVEELTQIAQFIYNIDPDIPWHLSRFFPRFQFLDYEATHMHSLEIAADIGRKMGIKHVYIGNV